MIRNTMSLLGVWFLAAACADVEPQPEAAAACDEAAARFVAERLGQRMRDVSLLAPDSIVTREQREAYGALVTDGLLREWQSEPARAPGRKVSNPWPARLEVASVAAASSGCRVEGAVLHVTSADTLAVVSRDSVTLLIEESDEWRVSEYMVGSSSDSSHRSDSTADIRDAGADGSVEPPADSTDAAAAVAVIREYFAMIDAGELRSAYALWFDDGAASGQTFAEFSRGFSNTDGVSAAIGEPGRIEGAAGSRYVEVPVRIAGEATGGAVRRYAGTFTLRRSVVDGATQPQRRWRISSADMRAVNE